MNHPPTPTSIIKTFKCANLEYLLPLHKRPNRHLAVVETLSCFLSWWPVQPVNTQIMVSECHSTVQVSQLSRSSIHTTLFSQKTYIGVVTAFFMEVKILFGFLSISKKASASVGLWQKWRDVTLQKAGDALHWMLFWFMNGYVGTFSSR